MTLFVWWAVAPFYHGLFLYHEMFHHDMFYNVMEVLPAFCQTTISKNQIQAPLLGCPWYLVNGL